MAFLVIVWFRFFNYFEISFDLVLVAVVLVVVVGSDDTKDVVPLENAQMNTSTTINTRMDEREEWLRTVLDPVLPISESVVDSKTTDPVLHSKFFSAQKSDVGQGRPC